MIGYFGTGAWVLLPTYRGGRSGGTGHFGVAIYDGSGCSGVGTPGTTYAMNSKMVAQSSREGCRATVTVTIESEQSTSMPDGDDRLVPLRIIRSLVPGSAASAIPT